MSENKILQVGHSPDPDDAFMFYGIQSGNVETHGYEIEHVIEDIETLNQRAMQGELEISAISLHCYSYVKDKYYILPCGVSMGDDYGPILVSSRDIDLNEVKNMTIAAPGELTTAALVAQIIFPGVELVHMPFDEIMPAVSSGKVDLGIVIHEGQLTYSQEKLINLLDFGKWWKKEKGLPLPLGVDVIRRDMPEDKMKIMQEVLTKSIQYALDNREPALEYALKFGRGLSDELADKFVGMYVNHYTVDFGQIGKEAVRKLLEEAYKHRIISESCVPVFSDEVLITQK